MPYTLQKEVCMSHVKPQLKLHRTRNRKQTNPKTEPNCMSNFFCTRHLPGHHLPADRFPARALWQPSASPREQSPASLSSPWPSEGRREERRKSLDPKPMWRDDLILCLCLVSANELPTGDFPKLPRDPGNRCGSSMQTQPLVRSWSEYDVTYTYL